MPISQCVGVQRSHQGDVIVINQLITIISPCLETIQISFKHLFTAVFYMQTPFVGIVQKLDCGLDCGLVLQA